MDPRRGVGKVGGELREVSLKGKPVFVEGKLQTRQWDDKDGKKQYTTEVQALNVQFLGQKSDGAGAPPPSDKDMPANVELARPRLRRRSPKATFRFEVYPQPHGVRGGATTTDTYWACGAVLESEVVTAQ